MTGWIVCIREESRLSRWANAGMKLTCAVLLALAFWGQHDGVRALLLPVFLGLKLYTE